MTTQTEDRAHGTHDATDDDAGRSADGRGATSGIQAAAALTGQAGAPGSRWPRPTRRSAAVLTWSPSCWPSSAAFAEQLLTPPEHAERPH